MDIRSTSSGQTCKSVQNIKVSDRVVRAEHLVYCPVDFI